VLKLYVTKVHTKSCKIIDIHIIFLSNFRIKIRVYCPRTCTQLTLTCTISWELRDL